MDAVADVGAAQRLRAQRVLVLGGEPVLLGRQVEGPDALQRAGLGEGDDAVHVARAQALGVHPLQVLEAQQAAAVDVAAGEVARGLEAVGVVGHVAAQHRDHLEHAGGRAVAGIHLRRRGTSQERCEQERAEARRHRRRSIPQGRVGQLRAVFRRLGRLRGRAARALSIFSVATTAAAS